jgi:hypothetical protein
MMKKPGCPSNEEGERRSPSVCSPMSNQSADSGEVCCGTDVLASAFFIASPWHAIAADVPSMRVTSTASRFFMDHLLFQLRAALER